MSVRMLRSSRVALALGAVLLLGACEGGLPEVGGDEDLFAVAGALVYTSPLADPIEDGVVVVVDGVIEAVGPRGAVPLPAAMRRVDATGLTLLPGFWNADVFIEDDLLELAEAREDEALAAALEERFSRFGFTTLVDTASEEVDLLPLLERLGSGDVPGPRILAAGAGLPPGVRQSGWWYGADADPEGEGRPAPAAGAALVPALTLASIAGEDESTEAAHRRLNDAVQAVREYRAGGGGIVFGTGAGYVPDYDPSGEFFLLEEAGFSFRGILATLTEEPAIRFGWGFTGTIEPGMAADLVLVEGDPGADLAALGRVRWVAVDGRATWSALR